MINTTQNAAQQDDTCSTDTEGNRSDTCLCLDTHERKLAIGTEQLHVLRAAFECRKL